MVFYLCSCSVTIPKYKRLDNFKEKNCISSSNWKLESLQFRATSGEGCLANGDSLRCSEVHDMVRKLMRYGQPGFNGRPVLVRIKPLTQLLQSLPNATTMYDFENHISFFFKVSLLWPKPKKSIPKEERFILAHGFSPRCRLTLFVFRTVAHCLVEDRCSGEEIWGRSRDKKCPSGA